LARFFLNHSVDGEFSRKSQIFPPTPCNYAPADGVPLGIGYRHEGSKNRLMGLPESQKSFKDRFSRLDTIPACDGQTSFDSEDRASIASRW